MSRRRRGSRSRDRRRISPYSRRRPPLRLPEVQCLSGQPALCIPIARDAGGLPVGVQLVGRPLEEATLFRLGAQMEEAAPWIGRMAEVAAPLGRGLHTPAR